jgi:hypothetical protein
MDGGGEDVRGEFLRAEADLRSVGVARIGPANRTLLRGGARSGEPRGAQGRRTAREKRGGRKSSAPMFAGPHPAVAAAASCVLLQPIAAAKQISSTYSSPFLIPWLMPRRHELPNRCCSLLVPQWNHQGPAGVVRQRRGERSEREVAKKLDLDRLPCRPSGRRGGCC